MHRQLFWVVVSFLVVLFPGNPLSAQDAGLTPWVCPEGFEGQTLNLYNWATYTAEDTVPNFEKLCGVNVVSSFFASNEEMLDVLRNGNPGYDIIVPADQAVAILIEESLLIPLERDRIPNLANVYNDLRESVYDPTGDYSVPYLLGTFGIGYNTRKVSEAIDSWEQFFEYDGPVAWIDDMRTMLSIALMMVGADPNSSDPGEINAARRYLLDHSRNVVTIAQDDGQEWLARGEVDMVIEYNGDIFQLGLDCACADYAYVIPKQGAGISAGFMAIPQGAQNPALAHVFLDYVLDPQVGADIANYTTYPSPNRAAVDAGLIDPALLENKGIYPPDHIRERLFFMALHDLDTETFYNDIWTRIKIEVGL